MEGLGKILVAVGVLIVIAGLLLWLFGSKLSWLGNLPGDIKIERENFTFYFPLTTMILISILLSLLLWLAGKIFK